MELKDFVKRAIVDLDQAIEEANKETHRAIRFRGVQGQRTALEFDIAVTVENSSDVSGGAGIKVLGLAEVGGQGASLERSSTVSRISFGVHIDESTKAENVAIMNANFRNRQNPAV